MVGLLTFEAGWGAVRNRESRVFRSPEVGISAIANSKKRCSFVSFFLEGFVHFPNNTLHRIGQNRCQYQTEGVFFWES